MSTTLKQKMAGRLAGSLKSTHDRLDKADEIMAAGGLLRPQTPVPGSEEEPDGTTSVPKRPGSSDRGRAKGNGAGRAQRALQADSTALAAKKSSKVGVTGSMDDDTPGTKVRVQRETFTMLPNENDRINEVRTRAAANKVFTNRSAVIRAGVLALERLSDAQLVQVLGQLPVIKPGRG